MNYICTLLDDRFVKGYIALVKSLLRHTVNFDKTIIVIDVGISKENKELLKSHYSNIIFERVDANISAIWKARYKIYLHHIAKKYGGILYLDSDIIFLESIDDLINIKIDTDIGICPTVFTNSAKHKYNTGVMLIKGNDNYQKLLKNMKRCVNKFGSYIGDQPIIIDAIENSVITVTILDRKWNVTKRDIIDYKLKEYANIHFVAEKPFEEKTDKYKKLEDIWWEYYGS